MANAVTTDIQRLTANDDGIYTAPRQGIAVHTFEDDGNWPAEKMGEYQQRPDAGGSYHIVIDKDGRTCRENDDDYISWSAMFTGNRRFWHVSLSGKAAFTRKQWLERSTQLDALADVIALYARDKGFPVRKLTPADVAAGKWGVCGHWDISQAWHESDHTDPGPNFPWDYVLTRATENLARLTGSSTNRNGDNNMSELTGVSAAALNDAKRAAQDNQVQLRGPQLKGWPQLGGRTLVDAVATIGVHLGIDGFRDVTGKISGPKDTAK